MVVGGAVMIPVGALVLAIAVLLGPRSDCKTDEFGAISREELERCTDKTPKYVLGVGGGLLVVGGIALVSVGAQRVPKKAAHAGISPWLSREAAGLNLRLEL
jgi:hypothetical protein